MGGHLRRAGGRRGCAGSPVHRLKLHQGPPLRRRRKRGALAHGIGRTSFRRAALHASMALASRGPILAYWSDLIAHLRLELAHEIHEIGRASCRERGCQYVWILVGAVSFKKKKR